MGKSKKTSGKKRKAAARSSEIPSVILPQEDAPKITTKAGSFDLEDPVLPKWVAEGALASGGYPYDDEMKEKKYKRELELLQVELTKLQISINTSGQRILALFEGRDAAGKGGSINAIRDNLNPRSLHVAALPKPTDIERGQWYFQRYVARLPAAGEIVLFDRSWYNRAGVEPIMGFCTDSESRFFLNQAPVFEKMLADDGIVMFKFWLNIGREMQLKRFHDRRHDPLKIWKLSPVDFAAITKWDDYTRAIDRMIAATDTPATPWTVVSANDKRRAHLSIIRHVLSSVDYRGKDKAIVNKPDARILGGPALLRA